MFDMDKIEKLREKTGITYEEAKAVLQETAGDMLDAFILLEQRGRIQSDARTAKAQTVTNEQPYVEAQYTKAKEQQEERKAEDSVSFGEIVGRFFKWVGRIIHRGNQNTLHVTRGNENFISVPVTVLVLFLLLAFWIVFPLLIIGLFCGFRYHFTGPDLGTEKVNQTMNNVSDSAQQAVHNMKEAGSDFAHDVKKGASEPHNTVKSQDDSNEENNSTN